MKVSDADLKTRVTAALQRSKALADSKISVRSVDAGVVLLEGKAKTLSDHRRALEIAAREPGTVRVLRRKNVPLPKPGWSRGMLDLRNPRLRRPISQDPGMPAGSCLGLPWAVSPASTPLSEGVLEMNRIALSFVAACLIASAQAVPMVVNAEPPTAAQKTGDYVEDSVLTTKVKAALLTEADLKSLPISVESSEGVVTLSGEVVSSAQIDQAVDVAKHVKGVKDVHNALALKSGK